MVMQISDGSLYILIRTPMDHLNVDIETITNLLLLENVNVDSLKTLYAKEVDYSKDVPPRVCFVCWEIVPGSLAQHLSATHPSCYCLDKIFENIEKLKEHFKSHTLRNQKCPVCPIKYENLYHAITHLELHQSSALHLKSKCDTDLGLPLCAQRSVDGFEHLRHILTFSHNQPRLPALRVERFAKNCPRVLRPGSC